jgi:tetratricopeptide (TPR) repeat protein
MALDRFDLFGHGGICYTSSFEKTDVQRTLTMRRAIALWICVPVFVLGCGTSEVPVDTVENPAPDSTTQSRFASSEVAAEETTVTSADVMGMDVAKLIQRATKLEMQGETESSLVAWGDVVQRVSQEYGEQSWQTTSAKLSLSAARQRGEFEVAQRVKALEIVDLENQSRIELATGRLDQAMICLVKANDLAQDVWGSSSHITLNIQFQLASYYDKAGSHDDGFGLVTKVLAGRQELLGTVHPDTLEALELAAALATTLGKQKESIAWGAEAIEVAELLEGGESLAVARQRNNAGVALVQFKDYDRGVSQLETALEIRQKLLGPESVEVAHTLYNLGQAYMSQGDWNEAARRFDSVCEILTGQEREVASLSDAKIQLGTLALIQNDLAGAELEFRTAQSLLKESPLLYEREFAAACFKLGFVLGRQGKYSVAEPELRQALEIQQRILPVDDPALVQTQEIYTLVEGKLKGIRTGQVPGSIQR